MTKAILLVFILMAANIANGQTTFRGTVTDKEEHKTVSNAVVSIIRSKDSVLLQFTRTDQSGKYQIKYAPEGNFILMVSQPA